MPTSELLLVALLFWLLLLCVVTLIVRSYQGVATRADAWAAEEERRASIAAWKRAVAEAERLVPRDLYGG